MSALKRDDKKYSDGTKQLNVHTVQLPRPLIEQNEKGNKIMRAFRFYDIETKFYKWKFITE